MIYEKPFIEGNSISFFKNHVYRDRVVSNNFIISETNMASEEVSEEIEAVTAILDEDTVDIQHDDAGNPVEISIKITPLTASEQEKQYVSLTLVVTISEGEEHGALVQAIPFKIDDL